MISSASFSIVNIVRFQKIRSSEAVLTAVLTVFRWSYYPSLVQYKKANSAVADIRTSDDMPDR